MLIDFHTHAFPDKIAPRAMENLSATSNKIPETDGTLEGLIKKMDLWKVDMAVICNIATNPGQESNVNTFSIETAKKYDRVIPLGSLNPLSDSAESEIRRLKDAGIKGIKIHPDYMGKTLDSPEFDIIFELCIEYGMFVVTHAGVDAYSPNFVHATPDMIASVIQKHPNLRLVAAHFGSNLMWDEVIEKLCSKPVWIDTSLACSQGMDRITAERIITSHDPDRILFGSDAPWCSAQKCYEFIDLLSIPENVKEKIYSTNAEKLLSM